jgi:YHS domain-containing protein
MKIICQNCNHLIENEFINAGENYYFCNDCKNAFKISDLLNNNNENEVNILKGIINNPPKGTWKHEDYDHIVIGATTRSPIAFFLIPFMTVWTGGAIGGIYLTQIIKGEFDLFVSLFGIPFIIGAIIFWSLTLMVTIGKVEIIIGKESYVFTGVGRIGIKRKFDWNSIIRIYEEKNNGNWSFSFNRNSSSIFIEGKTRIKFGDGLKEERKYYLVAILKYLHNKKENYGT